MSAQHVPVVSLGDVAPDRRRGGELRTLLSPKSVGSTSGFLGVAGIQPGDYVAEHYHPYSEEFVFVVQGSLVVDLDGTPRELHADQGLMVPIGVRHRFRNVGPVPARVVFHLCPLAPRPELGHVDTETHTGSTSAVGGE
ncbi:cupin domain-containing protein [Streptomyces sp. LX-29]|uniref:cupin domain-containing protein n=1 Tax=Streptomyces sp. LX-29 TaxID=2900152 RepID=UPI00240DE256|nr:cupin domain-containing protein [Streptomyces sp. LX-29]WFB11021.1 cupin domain-containing protein [Streptomyces sp. LX-29]